MKTKFIFLLTTFAILNFSNLYSEVTLNVNGQEMVLDLQADNSIGDLLMVLSQTLPPLTSPRLLFDGELQFDVDDPTDPHISKITLNLMPGKGFTQKASVFRNYQAPLTYKEKRDISFIVQTLGTKSLVKILLKKPQLNKAGDRIDHVHPLNFLGHIFSDDELIVYVKNIQSRGGLLWKSFFSDGLKKSLEEEANKSNMDEAFVIDFASKIGIDYQLIKSPYENKDWNNLLNTLLVNAPKRDNTNRYDM